ncbi:MAG: hypothetical protein F4W95_14585 [Chloroflexi bacterium]|nr:hypothetical protein [Chloroflexota bacterium]MYD49685.1 hypothetical protein [Chloroflexota bacterium]
MVTTRVEILKKFELFQGGTGGLDSWLDEDTPPAVFDALADLENRPLTRARLNQLLTLSNEAPVSDAFFRYYWLSASKQHPYDVGKIPGFDGRFCSDILNSITSLDQLYWGLYRFYVDALLFFGNVRTAFQRLRSLTEEELSTFFIGHRFNTREMLNRGVPVAPQKIDKGERYLISEMACKSLEAETFSDSELATNLLDLYRNHAVGAISVGQLLENDDSLEGMIDDLESLESRIEQVKDAAIELYRRHCENQITAGDLLKGAERRGTLKDIQPRLFLTADDFLDLPIIDENDLMNKIQAVHRAYVAARKIALNNTQTYLSMVGDLDVYVATSMRSRDDFREMADFCEKVFEDPDLKDLNLRYFDPTLSAAEHHEDKGLLECLMVRRAKALVLYAGSRDSFGKDAEAAMALSLGKPVIIHSDEAFRSQFYRDVHPLSRLIDFKTGVAIGAMVATSTTEVVQLLRKTFENDIEYRLEQAHENYLVLKEKTTNSVVRLQTSDRLIRETFWNHYHSDVR